MLGLLVEILISWVLLRLFAKTNLAPLGLTPSKSNLFDLGFGILCTLVICLIYNLSLLSLADNEWVRNSAFDLKKIGSGTRWVLVSVMYEELIFRGALLYLAVSRFGEKTAIILSAFCFGIYHWFTMGAWGNPIQMVFIFLMTAIAGWIFALAYVRTKSMYLPLGLHFGWNWMSTLVFSNGPLGDQLLIPLNDNKLTGPLSLILFAFQVFAMPVLVYFYLQWRRIKPQFS